MADEPTTILDDLTALAESLRVAGDERHERMAAAVLERLRAQPQAAQVPEGYELVPDSYVSAVNDMVSWLVAWRRASLAVGRQATYASEAIDAMLAAAQAQGVQS